MNRGGIRIEKVLLRMRGVTPSQARVRADALTGQIADAAARESLRKLPQRAVIEGFSIHLRAGEVGDSVAGQMERQWPRR